MNKKNYRPTRRECLLGGVMGLIFALVGISTILEKSLVVGLVWTALSVGLAVYNFCLAFGKDPTPARREDKKKGEKP